jgi:hypothetical protein
MPIVDAFGGAVAARLLEFFASSTPWQRRLWSPSVSLALKEVLEASHAVQFGILNEATLASSVEAALSLAGVDPGIGSDQQKRALQVSLKKTLTPDGVDYAAIELVIKDLDRNYLERWAQALESAAPPSIERSARCVAAHLLDAGFSARHLHKWSTFQLRNAAGVGSLPELVRRADAMLKTPAREFSVMVPFDGVSPSKSGLPANWISARDLTLWLAARKLETRGLVQNGALLFRVLARDPWAAVEHTVDVVDQLSARVALAGTSRLISAQSAYVEGADLRFPFRRESRQVQVRALHREDKMYTLEAASIVDAALHMVGTLNFGPPSTAIGAGWAALEALLSGPGDADIIAGHRTGELVACSFARAELTELSYRVEQAGHALAPRLQTCATNRDRAVIIADAIMAGTALNLAEASDGAAEKRLAKILANPHERLREVRNYATAAFIRMYKNRNLVLHWGKADAVGLRSNLRTVAPLVGAGIDRIAHAWFVENIRPRELSARARIALETVGSSGGPSVADLLT